jgi:hypothetical protein
MKITPEIFYLVDWFRKLDSGKYSSGLGESFDFNAKFHAFTYKSSPKDNLGR